MNRVATIIQRYIDRLISEGCHKSGQILQKRNLFMNRENSQTTEQFLVLSVMGGVR